MSKTEENALPSRALQAAFLVACALILFQVSFTRLISFKMFYHFVFLAISTSLLGLGAAGTFVAVRGAQSKDKDLLKWLAILAISVPIALVFLAHPLPQLQSTLKGKYLGSAAVVYLLWCCPIVVWLNFCGGVVLTSLFSTYSSKISRLYAADLLGAGFGSLLCIAIMKYASPPVAFLSATALIALAIYPFFQATPKDDRGHFGTVSIVALLASAFIAFGPAYFRSFQSSRYVVKSEWNHLIRTDHLRDNPYHRGDWYILDADAGTIITRWNPSLNLIPRSPVYACTQEKPVVGVIGVGGGEQLAEARYAKASEIVAIDINPTILKWATGQDRQRNNDLYMDPSISVRLGEGRHQIRAANKAFDVIVMHAIDTYAATASGAYSLTENFLYTKEAFWDYYKSLDDDGVMSISRWLFNPPRENLRLFATAVAALSELGLEAEKHLIVIAPVANYDNHKGRVWGYLLMSKKPFSDEQIQKVREHVKKLNWTILYAPDKPSGTPFDDVAAKDQERMDKFQASYPYLINAVTDSSPYLFQFYNPFRTDVLKNDTDVGTWEVYQSSAFVLLGTLVVSIAASFAIIILPLLRWRGRSDESDEKQFTFANALYFTGLGSGLMAREIPLIQCLSLYLGHPTYGFSVVLVALLISTGLGSLMIDKFPLSPAQVCAGIAVILMVMAFGLFPFVHHTLEWSDPIRFATALLMTGACGLLMGMPLAMGIRQLGQENERNVAWAWGLNGAASVVGACLVQICMVFGSSSVSMILGVFCYLMSCVAARKLS